MTSVLKVRDYSSKVFDMVNNISFFPKLISFFQSSAVFPRHFTTVCHFDFILAVLDLCLVLHTPQLFW